MPTAAIKRETSPVLSALWRARWLILVAALLAGAGGYLVSGLQEPTYSAQSRMVLRAVEDFDPLGRQSYTDSSRFVANQVSIADSEPVVNAAAQALGDGTTLEELTRALDVSASADAAVVLVRASGPTAASAAARADAVVQAYRDYVRQRVVERARDAAAATTDQVVVDQITTQAAAYGDGLAVVDGADVPTRASSPVPLRDGLLLAAVAALVAAGLALLRRPAASPRPVSEGLGLRLLGSVPVPKGKAGQGAVDPSDYAVPLVSLGYVADLTAGPVLVTGLSAQSGGADVAHGLAVAAAAQGQRVLVVDADPDDRPLLTRTGLGSPRRSLTDLAAGASEEDVLVGATGPAGAGRVDVAVLGGDGATPLPSGGKVESALRRLGASHDLVLVSTAPVAESALAFGLLWHATAVVLAVGAKEGGGRLPELEQRLELAQVPLVGALRTVPRRGAALPSPVEERTHAPVAGPGRHATDTQPESITRL